MYNCEVNCIGLRNQREEVVALMSRISIERDHNICDRRDSDFEKQLNQQSRLSLCQARLAKFERIFLHSSLQYLSN